MNLSFGRVIFLVLAFACLGLCSLEAQDSAGSNEVEVSATLISSLQPSDPGGAAKLYDHLAYGKGQFVRSEGKSRKSAVLTLDGQKQSIIRLFDLPQMDYKLLAVGTQYYFGGILSKIERTAEGVELTIIYANLSEVAGKFYSRQAQEFAQRTVHLQEQNEKILGSRTPSSETKPVVAAPQADAASPAKPRPATEQPSAPAPTQPAKSAPSPASAPVPSPLPPKSEPPDPKVKEEAAEDEEPAPRNRPVLKRRVESDRPPPEAEPSKSHSPDPKAVSQGPGDDVVVYRRKDGSRAPSSPSPHSDEMDEGVSTASERPTLRRKPGPKNEEKEVDGMVLISEGSVSLGSDDAADADVPINRVSVPAFYIDKTEVTNEEYRLFCEATGHSVPPYWVNKKPPQGLEKHPVTQVSWFDAQDYARWAGKRLPSEAEWERAAKGPNSFRYSYGNTYDPQKANTGLKKTCPVSQYTSNEFGIFDMTGNVFEWTNSLFKPYPYQSSDGREDPKASGSRVIRGGGFASSERDARCLVRQKDLPDNGSPLLGFRCARNPS